MLTSTHKLQVATLKNAKDKFEKGFAILEQHLSIKPDDVHSVIRIFNTIPEMKHIGEKIKGNNE